jgi:hypothetical protein
MMVSFESGGVKFIAGDRSELFCENRWIKCHVVACVSYQPTLNNLEKYRL